MVKPGLWCAKNKKINSGHFHLLPPREHTTRIVLRPCCLPPVRTETPTTTTTKTVEDSDLHILWPNGVYCTAIVAQDFIRVSNEQAPINASSVSANEEDETKKIPATQPTTSVVKVLGLAAAESCTFSSHTSLTGGGLQPSYLNPRTSTIVPQPSYLNYRISTLVPQPSYLNHRYPTIVPQPLQGAAQYRWIRCLLYRTPIVIRNWRPGPGWISYSENGRVLH